MWYKFAQSQDDIQKLVDFFLEKYPYPALRGWPLVEDFPMEMF